MSDINNTLERLVQGVVDWADSGHTNVGRPLDTLDPDETIKHLTALIQSEVRDGQIDELKRLTGFSARGIFTMGENAFDPPIKVEDRIKSLQKGTE